jgi:hypothetical protein
MIHQPVDRAVPSIRDELVRWRCPACGEIAMSRDVAWVEHARATHHCGPDPLAIAQQGGYDG